MTPSPPPRRTQAQRREATTESLLAAARPLFASKGFAAVGTTELCEAAGLSRGALYHHFADKTELFAAVAEQVEAELTDRIVSEMGGGSDAVDVLRQATRSFLDGCMEPDVRQILLLDSPAVLGWAQWRDLMARYGLGLTEAALQAGMDEGTITPAPVTALAQMLLGALDEAALLIANSADPRSTRTDVESVVDLLIEAVRLR